ncbi:MAG: ATP-binding protein [Pseudomonadota bacterium]
MTFRPRLSTILMVVNVAVIALPLGSIFFFRIYENQLVQETERELISQGAVIGAAYRAAILGAPEPAEVVEAWRSAGTRSPQGRLYTPVSPVLDLARVDTLPARPDGYQPKVIPNAVSVAAGRLLSPVLKQAQLTTLIGVRILDNRGTVVGGTAELGLNFSHVEEVAQALDGRYAAVLRFREIVNPNRDIAGISRGTGVRVFVAFPVKEGAQVLGVIYLSRTPKSVLRHMYDERDKVILAMLTVLALSASLAALTSLTISRPVAELLKRTRAVATGTRTDMAVLENPGTSEMAQLSDGIARMATALTDRAQYIRTLASHVSHEFKTPLASIQGAAELLQDHHDTMSAEDRERFLTNISSDGARLKALLDRLLELARAENAERGEVLIPLAPAVDRALAGLPDGISGTAEVADGLEARIAEDALDIVLANLTDNAAQHGADRIEITARSEAEAVVIDVRDNGTGISPANRTKIFEHFFTTRRESGGTGLGLGIVRALVTAHGGTIDLAETDGPGTMFRITLTT